MKTIVMTAVGGLEVIDILEFPEPVPGPGEALVEIAAAGVNFMDIGVRNGMAWHEMPLPRALGVEGAGRVLALGEGVTDLAVGQRVAWVYAPGSYAERLAIPAASLVPIPDDIDDRTAASLMMQGLTASHFATDFYPVQPGDLALVHAAAGGLGQLLTQIVKLRGGTVIGRVSSEAKVAAARAAGADHVIVDAEGDFAAEVLRLTGAPVEVIERCSAVDGTWGMKAAYYDEGRRYARRLADAIDNEREGNKPFTVVTVCSLAALRIKKETGAEARHPIELLAAAYGLEGFSA